MNTKRTWNVFNNYDKSFLIKYLNENLPNSAPTKKLVSQMHKVDLMKKYLDEMFRISKQIEETKAGTSKWFRLHEKHLEYSQKISELSKDE